MRARLGYCVNYMNGASRCGLLEEKPRVLMVIDGLGGVPELSGFLLLCGSCKKICSFRGS